MWLYTGDFIGNRAGELVEFGNCQGLVIPSSALHDVQPFPHFFLIPLRVSIVTSFTLFVYGVETIYTTIK